MHYTLNGLESKLLLKRNGMGVIFVWFTATFDMPAAIKAAIITVNSPAGLVRD